MLRLNWRLVTSEPNVVAADDRYVAIMKDRYPAPSPLTLIDQQAHTQRSLGSWLHPTGPRRVRRSLADGRMCG